MPVTPTYSGATPTNNADFDTWGVELNDALGDIKVDLDALAAQGNASETAATGAVQKTGSTSTGDQVLADVAATSQFSAGFRGLPVVSINADRTFLNTDAAKMIRLFGSDARTWTIPPNVFQVGTAIALRSYSTANLTVARGAGVTLTNPGANINANKTLASFGFATLVQEDTNIWILSGVGVS